MMFSSKSRHWEEKWAAAGHARKGSAHADNNPNDSSGTLLPIDQAMSLLLLYSGCHFDASGEKTIFSDGIKRNFFPMLDKTHDKEVYAILIDPDTKSVYDKNIRSLSKILPLLEKLARKTSDRNSDLHNIVEVIKSHYTPIPSEITRQYNEYLRHSKVTTTITDTYGILDRVGFKRSHELNNVFLRSTTQTEFDFIKLCTNWIDRQDQILRYESEYLGTSKDTIPPVTNLSVPLDDKLTIQLMFHSEDRQLIRADWAFTLGTTIPDDYINSLVNSKTTSTKLWAVLKPILPDKFIQTLIENILSKFPLETKLSANVTNPILLEGDNMVNRTPPLAAQANIRSTSTNTADMDTDFDGQKLAHHLRDEEPAKKIS